MSSYPAILLAVVLGAARAGPPAVPSELTVAGHRAHDIECSLLEGGSLAVDALTTSLGEGADSLDRCVGPGRKVKVQWSWGGEKGATVVATRWTDEATANCVEPALRPRVVGIVGYCSAWLPLEELSGPDSLVNR